MKRCPQCYVDYAETERFCEADGQELLADPASAPDSSRVVVQAPTAAGPSWLPAAILGVLIGIGIGAGIFAAITLSSGSKASMAKVGPAFAPNSSSCAAAIAAPPATTAATKAARRA